MSALAVQSLPVEFPAEVIAAAERGVWGAGFTVQSAIEATPLRESDVVDGSAEEALVPDFDALTEQMLDRLGDALLAHTPEVMPVDLPDEGEETEAQPDDAYLENRAWRHLFDSVINQPLLFADSESMLVEGASRREIMLEFSPLGGCLWENGAGATPEHWLKTELGCGLTALLAPLASYLRYLMFERGEDPSEVEDCFSVGLLRNLLETGIARVGLADVPVAGIGTVLATYYFEIVSRVVARRCDELASYERITLSAPEWLLPYVVPCQQLHPKIAVVAA